MEGRQSSHVPSFTHDARTWFTQLEASWHGLTDITDLSKFHTVVRGLPAEVASRISDTLAAPPAEGKYEAIKSAVISALGKTRDAYFMELESIQLEGRRPSALLTTMEDLNRAAGRPLSDELLRFRHARLMPQAIRVQLAAVRGSMSTKEYGELVDGIYDAHIDASPPVAAHACEYRVNFATLQPTAPAGPSSPCIAKVTTTTPVREASPNLPSHTRPDTAAGPQDDTAARLARVEQTLLQLQLSLDPRQQHTSLELCYYHRRFGTAARNCRFPCAHQGNGQGGGR